MGHMGHGQSVLVGHIFAWPIICLSQVVPVLSHSVWGLKLKIWSRIWSNLSSSWWYIHIFYCQNHQNVFLDQYRHLRLVGQSVQTTSNYSNFAGILFFTFRAKKSLKSYSNGYYKKENFLSVSIFKWLSLHCDAIEVYITVNSDTFQ